VEHGTVQKRARKPQIPRAFRVRSTPARSKTVPPSPRPSAPIRRAKQGTVLWCCFV